MRIIILGRFLDKNVTEVEGLGYGWEDRVYFDPCLIDEGNVDIGVVSEGIDFERIFYQINEKNLINLEEVMES